MGGVNPHWGKTTKSAKLRALPGQTSLHIIKNRQQQSAYNARISSIRPDSEIILITPFLKSPNKVISVNNMYTGQALE